MSGKWICIRCGDVVGVYEPATVIDRSLARATSRLAESSPPQAVYHTACFEQARLHASTVSPDPAGSPWAT